MKLRKTTLGMLGAAQLLASGAVLAQDAGPFDVSNFSMTLWGTTDYMFRGISNTEGPALQASVDWGYKGFYLGVWGSPTEFSDSQIEIDFYGGYRFSFFGLGFDVSGLYYAFPGENDEQTDPTSDGALDPVSGALFGGQEADYIEAQLIVSKAFEAAWSPSVALKYNYGFDNFGEDGVAHSIQGDAGVLVPLGFLGDIGFGVTLGYSTVEGDHSSGCDNLATNPAPGTPGAQPCLLFGDGTALDGYDYVWGRVGAYRDVFGFKVDVSYFMTDQSEDLRLFYSDIDNFLATGSAVTTYRDLIEPHVVLTVSRSFAFP